MPTPRGHSLRSVRTIKGEDILPLRGRSRPLDSAIASLRSAISLRDPKLLKVAIEAAGYLTAIPGATTEYDWSDMSLKKLMPAARWEYSFLMSFALRDVKIVLWSPENGIKPPALAMYCPDNASASFTLLAVGKLSLCANKKCRVPFTPSSPRQIYHSEQCGSATRARRSRNRTGRS